MNNILKLSIRVVLLFIGAIALSYVPVLYPKIFGDWLCEGSEYIKKVGDDYSHIYGCDRLSSRHNPRWHWGYQHFLWFFMGLCLMIIQIADIIIFIKKSNSK